MNWLFDNLKRARELLSLNQKEAADGSGVSQMDISKLENYKKEFIPSNYILFLHNKGIDLNSVFDEKSGGVKFRNTGEASPIVAPKTAPNIAPNQENGPFSKSGKDQLQEYDSRLKSLENSVKDILKRLPE